MSPTFVGKMPEDHKRFLISVKKGEPDWSLLNLPGAKDLPAVRWKLENLAKLGTKKRSQLLAGLRIDGSPQAAQVVVTCAAPSVALRLINSAARCACVAAVNTARLSAFRTFSQVAI